MSTDYREHIPLIIIVLLTLLTFFIVKPLFVAIFLGALLAYISFFFFSFLTKRIKHRSLAALITCLIVFLIIVVPGIFLVKTLVQESYVLFILGKQKLATGLFKSCQSTFCNAIEEFGKDPSVAYQIQEILKTVTNSVVQKGSRFLLGVPQILLSLFITFFTMYYFLKDGEKLIEKLGIFFALKQKKYFYVMTRLKEILHGIVYGYGLIAVIQGLAGGIGFWLFGLSSPLFWGVVMALFALIPFLGTGLIWAPAALIILFDGLFQNSNTLIFKGIGLFIYGLLFISSLDNLLKPKLMAEKAKVHPVVIVLGIFGGVFVFGVVGVILGPLVLSMTLVLLDAYVLES